VKNRNCNDGRVTYFMQEIDSRLCMFCLFAIHRHTYSNRWLPLLLDEQSKHAADIPLLNMYTHHPSNHPTNHPSNHPTIQPTTYIYKQEGGRAYDLVQMQKLSLFSQAVASSKVLFIGCGCCCDCCYSFTTWMPMDSALPIKHLHSCSRGRSLNTSSFFFITAIS
jgi:hypothetical protein